MPRNPDQPPFVVESGKGEASKPSVASGQEKDDPAAHAFLDSLRATFNAAGSGSPQQQDPEAPVALTFRDLAVLGGAIQKNGAYLVVMREVLLALTALVPGEQRRQVETALRAGAEAILMATESQGPPAVFQEVAITEINAYLNCLRRGEGSV